MESKSRIMDNEQITVNGIPLPSRKTRRHIVTGVILFNFIVIMYTIIYGNPQNSLHVSALSWAYSSMIAVVFAYVFGAVADNFNVWKSQIGSKS